MRESIKKPQDGQGPREIVLVILRSFMCFPDCEGPLHFLFRCYGSYN